MIRYTIGCAVLVACWLIGTATAQTSDPPPPNDCTTNPDDCPTPPLCPPDATNCQEPPDACPNLPGHQGKGVPCWASGISPEAATERQHIRILRLSVASKLDRKCIANPYLPYQYPNVRTIPVDRLRPIRRTWQTRERWAIRQPNRCAANRIPAWPWLALARCESGLDWDYNGSSGYDGGFQFLPSTWTAARRGITSYAYAYQAPAYVQYRVARSWLARTSWLQWPVCSRKIGAR